MANVTDSFIDFAQRFTFDKIPDDVIHESKRVLLDGLGNALGGIASDKGKIGIMQAKLMGGIPESTVIGTGDKCSAPVAAFANAELWNGLDMDPVPHIPPIVIPAILAMAQRQKASGKETLRALCVGQEIARRLSRVLLSIMSASIMKYGKTPAQVILRWHTQMGFAVIPGSRNVDHIRDNLNILDFELTDEEMKEIAKLDKNQRYYHRTDEQLIQFAAWRPEFER